MLLCLDEVGTPFQRIWCCFEQVMIIQQSSSRHEPGQSQLVLVIAKIVGGENGTAVVITDGRAAPVLVDLQEGPQFALELKRD